MRGVGGLVCYVCVAKCKVMIGGVGGAATTINHSLASFATTDCILLLASSEQRPSMGAEPAVNLIPASAVLGHSLLQVAHPELPLLRRGAAQQTI